MRIAYASPLPPAKSGIADYSAELIPHLAERCEIEIFTDPGLGSSSLLFDDFPIHAYCELPAALRAGRFDLALYQLGNNADFHREIYRLLLAHPGVVVLHEFMLHHLIRGLTLSRGDVAGYLEEHRYCAGRSGWSAAKRSVDSGMPFDIWSYPLFERVVDSSRGVIVHSRFAERRVLASRPGARIARVPQHLDLSALGGPSDRAEQAGQADLDEKAARQRLGVGGDQLVVASFGLATPAKRLEASLRAFARLRAREPRARYYQVGGVSPHYDLDRLLAGDLRDAVTVTGHLELEEFLLYMKVVDVAINLRHPTGGETSAVQMRLLGMGKAVIVSNTGSFREIPDGCCAKVDLDEREEDTLLAYLTSLAGDESLRREMGDNARRYMAEHHTLGGSAEGYATFLERVTRETGEPPPELPPLAPYPREDVATDLLAEAAAAAADLGVGEGEDDLLAGLAEVLVDLDVAP